MALLSRLSRLVAADAHAVLDSLEEPRLMLAAAVRDMDSAIGADCSKRDALQAEIADLDRARHGDSQRLQTLNGQLDLAMVAAQERLVRELVRRKLIVNRRLSSTNDAIEARRARIDELQRRIAARRRRLDEVKQRAALTRMATTADDMDAAAISEADIDIALLEERHSRQPS